VAKNSPPLSPTRWPTRKASSVPSRGWSKTSAWA